MLRTKHLEDRGANGQRHMMWATAGREEGIQEHSVRETKSTREREQEHGSDRDGKQNSRLPRERKLSHSHHRQT